MAIDALELRKPQTRRAGGLKFVADPLALDNGDHLTRVEFERRYQALPGVKKAELIEGVVHRPSPVHHMSHSKPHGMIMGWIATYCAATPGVDWGDNGTVRLDADNEVQPDALLRIEPAVGGHSRVTPDDYIEGAPELIVEVAYSSASYDLHDKLKVYRRNGVQEYMVWQVQDAAVDWFELKEGVYTQLPLDERGVIHSQVFPGLNLHVDKLLDGDLAGVLAELQPGLGTDAHKALVERLARTITTTNQA
ncbi:MAG TPA: Uma2 family endonuclease [Anaerolineae bacterium]|nr:Uma2 family endonuclease [Anaerolineae bacterium]